jgi:hypothetical protein
MGIEGISNVSRVNNFIGPSEVSSTVGTVNGSNDNTSFFHVMKDLASNETLIFRTDNGNIGGLVDHKDVGDISKVLNQQQYHKMEINPDLPKYLQFNVNTFV